MFSEILYIFDKLENLKGKYIVLSQQDIQTELENLKFFH